MRIMTKVISLISRVREISGKIAHFGVRPSALTLAATAFKREG